MVVLKHLGTAILMTSMFLAESRALSVSDHELAQVSEPGNREDHTSSITLGNVSKIMLLESFLIGARACDFYDIMVERGQMFTP